MKHPTSFFLFVCFLISSGYPTHSSGEPSGARQSPFKLNNPYTKSANNHLVGPLPFATPADDIGDSFAGLINVNYTDSKLNVDRNMFYWYFPAQNGNPKAPLVVWLQGGPGSSSMLGLLYLNGPLHLTKNNTELVRHLATWNREYGMIFIDNPVGTGFSYVKQETENGKSFDGYTKNQEEVARDLYVLLNKFFEMYPHLKDCDLYITGESYAGKYVPAIGEYIRQMNRSGRNKINLVGLGIGNGLTDPADQVDTLAEHAYNVGLIDDQQALVVEKYQRQVREAVEREDWLEALDARNALYDYITLCSGGVNYYDVRRYDKDDFSGMYQFLNMESVRESLNVGDAKFKDEPRVYDALKEDVMKSTSFLFPGLIESFKVLIYTGQWDYRDGVPAAIAWIRKIDWKDMDAFLKSPRQVWKNEGTVAGYAKNYINFTEVVVVGAGHMAPRDAPESTLDMITRWINDQGWN